MDIPVGCHFKVTHDGFRRRIGYVGLCKDGTKATPFSFDNIPPQPEGVRNFGGLSPTPEEALDALCNWLIYEDRREQGQKELDSEEACEEVRKFVAGLTRRA